jgi:nucleoside-diphosphate-sugar epimerase
MKNFNNQTITIIGGAGFIGCNLTRYLLKHNPKKIYLIDNLSSGNINFIPDNDKVEFIYCDISNSEKYKSIFPKETDYIFHLAAHFANQNSVEYPLTDTNVNVIGTLNTLEVAKNLNIKKLIYASSSCIYGNSSIMTEEDKLYPIETPYAINKLSGELYTKFYAEFHNVPTLSLRIFNTYGPYEFPDKYRNVTPKFIKAALNGDNIVITGDGTETRDFTYVYDTSVLFMKMALHELKDGSAFNAGTGKSISINELANTIIELTNSKSKIIYKNKRNWDGIKDRLSDISKSQKVFDYTPSITLKEGIQQTINWFNLTNIK